MFISNTLQKFVTMTKILSPILTDHSTELFSLSKEKSCLRGKGFWKFNSFLTKDQKYIIEIKKLMCSFPAASNSFQSPTKMGTLKT